MSRRTRRRIQRACFWVAMVFAPLALVANVVERQPMGTATAAVLAVGRLIVWSVVEVDRRPLRVFPGLRAMFVACLIVVGANLPVEVLTGSAGDVLLALASVAVCLEGVLADDGRDDDDDDDEEEDAAGLVLDRPTPANVMS